MRADLLDTPTLSFLFELEEKGIVTSKIIYEVDSGYREFYFHDKPITDIELSNLKNIFKENLK